MNIKLILGIFAPIAIVIILVVLSNVKIGFSVEKEAVNQVDFNSLFTNLVQSQNQILVQTLTLTNDFFIPRRFELPRLAICLNDKEGLKQKVDLGVKYSEGAYSRGSYDVIDELLLLSYGLSSKQSIELPAYGEKQIKVYATPVRLPRNQNTGSYEDYDELLLLELKENKRSYNRACSNLDSEELDNAVHININK